MIGLKGLDRAAVERILRGLSVHILNVTTASLDDLVEPVDLARRRRRWWRCPSRTATSRGWRRPGRPGLPELRLAQPARPAAPDVGRPLGRAGGGAGAGGRWCGCSAATTGGPTAATGWRRWRASGGSRWRCCPASAGRPTRGWRRCRRCRGAEQAALLACFREGGPENMRALLGRLARLAGEAVAAREARPVPRVGVWRDGRMLPLAAVEASGRPLVPILFYRSMLLADDHAPVEALAAALEARGHRGAAGVRAEPARRGRRRREVEAALAAARAGGARDGDGLRGGGRRRVAVRPAGGAGACRWCRRRRGARPGRAGQRGLAPADLAMHVVLPELDGRVLAGAVSFKEAGARDERFGLGLQVNRPEPDRVAQVARRIAALLRLQATPPAERRVAVLIPDYPAAAGRTGYAVGLDVPASVLAMLADLRAAGYAVEGVPETPRELMRMLERRADGLPLDGGYRAGAGRRWRRPGAGRRRTRRTGCSGSGRRGSARSSWRWRRTGGGARTGGRTITIRRCRRGMRWWRSGCGCARRSGCMRWCMSGRTGRWSGCRGRRWRCRRAAFPRWSPGRCRSSIRSSSRTPARRRRRSGGSRR